MKKQHILLALVLMIVIIISVRSLTSNRPEQYVDGVRVVEEDTRVLDIVLPSTITFSEMVLTTDTPLDELSEYVGTENLGVVAALNRVDITQIVQGSALAVPSSFAYRAALTSLPQRIRYAQTIPKLIIVSQEMQSFGAYESGVLVRSGAISTGKRSTPTPNKLYFANWKGEEVQSTFDDEWILKWNVNVENSLGIALHQYELPGRPSSHSCIRLSAQDARWVYHWVDEWILSDDGFAELAKGTPVIVYGEYDFDGVPPWRQLVSDLDAVAIPRDEVEDIVLEYLADIDTEAALREHVLLSV